MISMAVVEDESKEQERLQSFFKRFQKANSDIAFMVSYFSNGEEFLSKLHEGDYDLVFMDIDLESEINGLEVATRLRNIDSNVTIVFVTNLAQYAIEGYKVQAYDYIVKPYGYYDFSTRLFRICSLVTLRKKEKVIIKTDGMKVVVSTKDIFFVEVLDHKCVFHTNKGDYQSYKTLKEVEKELDGNFSLCNSCYLVNLDYVESIDGYTIVVKGHRLLMSHPKRKTFLKDLSLYLGR